MAKCCYYVSGNPLRSIPETTKNFLGLKLGQNFSGQLYYYNWTPNGSPSKSTLRVEF